MSHEATPEANRCDREIADLKASGEIAPCWLRALGELDWMVEKQLILAGLGPGETLRNQK